MSSGVDRRQMAIWYGCFLVIGGNEEVRNIEVSYRFAGSQNVGSDRLRSEDGA
jgi:hypothetical protein